jgi:hypothetical protein
MKWESASDLNPMPKPKTWVDPSGSPTSLCQVLLAFDADPAVESLLVFACDANGFNPGDLDNTLHSISKPVFGGVFPMVISDGVIFNRGTVVFGLPYSSQTWVMSGLDQSGAKDMDVWSDSGASVSFPHAPGRLIFAVVDGLSAGISQFIDTLFDQFGLDQNYIGGGAGSLSLVQRPCVICNQGLLANAAVVALIAAHNGVGVAHGWKAASRSMRVTESSGRRIISIDWRPAAEVYMEEVEAISGMRFADMDFFQIAKCHPLGILGLGRELVVRDPLKTDDGSLICVSDVSVNSMICILAGNANDLLEAASTAMQIAEANLRPSKPVAGLLMDCISRAIYLETRLQIEIDKACEGQTPTVGALTIGEIAGDSLAALEFHNKTLALCLLSDSSDDVEHA